MGEERKEVRLNQFNCLAEALDCGKSVAVQMRDRVTTATASTADCTVVHSKERKVYVQLRLI